ncbi:ectoine/hydroxyectoine ABC transporter permease subunit EhuD [Lichenihabitans sp. Uapishka_5]|uniref:ectoine/hydroxyectoine ABC transporter permease subunit EhuD n=1 Tax=Lichenihabitans sp. Uapishka_5 TaxID=3037302 RepID=UPI0029E8154C|nr:ectoine/hydroxyectoine ABC transporter permease subunit EhuD [Lichenihabitans sp. Uapishka_5]MDX7950333.1 ectoine/hydroxyectoine ABC transporter permease subunit EhuD [Lichenihabitans sp. Uapishka_5]
MSFDFAFAWEILPDLLRGAAVTLEVMAAGFLLALAGGLALALGRRSPQTVTRLACAAFIEFMRNTPLLVQLYFLFFVLPLGGITLPPITTGILALGLNYSAFLSEVYRSGIESVPRGQWEAARALDLPARDTWRRIVLPQAIPPMLPVLGNYLIGMFKDTPLLAVITVPEMMQAAKGVAGMTYRYNEPYTLLAALFLALSLPASLLFRTLETRLRG